MVSQEHLIFQKVNSNLKFWPNCDFRGGLPKNIRFFQNVNSNLKFSTNGDFPSGLPETCGFPSCESKFVRSRCERKFTQLIDYVQVHVRSLGDQQVCVYVFV